MNGKFFVQISNIQLVEYIKHTYADSYFAISRLHLNSRFSEAGDRELK